MSTTTRGKHARAYMGAVSGTWSAGAALHRGGTFGF